MTHNSSEAGASSSSSSSSSNRSKRSSSSSDNRIDGAAAAADDEERHNRKRNHEETQSGVTIDLTEDDHPPPPLPSDNNNNNNNNNNDDKQSSSKKKKKSSKEDSQTAAAGTKRNATGGEQRAVSASKRSRHSAAAGTGGVNIRAIAANNTKDAIITTLSLRLKGEEIRQHALNAQKKAREQASEAYSLVLRLQEKTSSDKDCELVDYPLEQKAVKKLKGGPCSTLEGRSYTGEAILKRAQTEIIHYPHGLGSATLQSGDTTHWHRWIYTGRYYLMHVTVFFVINSNPITTLTLSVPYP